MSFCHKRNLHYISDEIFALCAFNSPSVPFVSALSLLDNPSGERADAIRRSHVHVIWSLSKDLGSPGVRMVSLVVLEKLCCRNSSLRRFSQGCVVSQANKPLIDGVSFSSFWEISSLTTSYTVTLLTSSELPRLVELNSVRLTRSYEMMTAALDRWGIEYIPVHAGVSLWARITKTTTTWEEEAAKVKILFDEGVAVAGGKPYFSTYGQIGWVRILFAVKEDVMKEAIKRMKRVLKVTV